MGECWRENCGWNMKFKKLFIKKCTFIKDVFLKDVYYLSQASKNF